MIVIVTIPTTGASLDVILLNNLGKYPSSAAPLNTLAMVNCHPSKDPKHDITRPITILPATPLNMDAKAKPNGALLLTSSFAGTIPKIILVDTI